MVSCDFENFGCSGGYLIASVDYLEAEGVATEECMPYLDKDRYCFFECDNPSVKYEKYYCKTGSLELGITHREI